MTKVIDLIGGSGLGKSTTASGLFYHMKLKGINCELVSEFVKSLAWAGQKVTPLDQLYIAGQQSHREALLYGKVDYIVTDSPLILSGLYDEYYNKRDIFSTIITNFIKDTGIEHHYFFLKRNKPFDPRGRYEDEATAKDIDSFIKTKLNQWEITFTEIDCPDEQRVQTIMDLMRI